MKYAINAKLFNAVIAAQANNQELRYYLSGFFLCAEHGEIVATNGHIMCVAPIEPVAGQLDWQECNVPAGKTSGAGWIFSGITKPLLRSADSVVIDTDECMLYVYGVRHKGPERIALKQIDASFVNYRSVKADRFADEEVIAERGFNTEYLYRCFKWAGLKPHDCVARMIFPKSQGDSAEIHINGDAALSSLHITLMPVRLK